MRDPLEGAKWVIPETKTVRVGGSKIDVETVGLELDLTKQTKADIQYLLRAITIDEVENQIRLDNPPSRIMVDGSSARPLESVTRRTEVTFGTELDVLIIGLIEKQLRRAILRQLPWESESYEDWRRYGVDEIANIQSSWQWMYRAERGEEFQRLKNARQYFRQNPFAIGGKLILRPNRTAAGLLNRIATLRGINRTARRGANKGQTRTEFRGFMAESIRTLKRSRFAKNYTIYVSYTQRFQSDDEVWKYGSPVINVIAKQRLRNGRPRAYRRF